MSIASLESIELTKPLAPLWLEPEQDRVRLDFTYDGLELGSLLLPAPDGRVLPGVLRDTAAARFAWSILGRYFARTWYPRLRFEEAFGSLEVFDGDRIVATLDTDSAPAPMDGRLHDAVGWPGLLESLFSHVVKSHEPATRARAVPGQGAPLPIELMEPVPALSIASGPGRWIAGTLAGRLAAMLWLDAGEGVVAGDELHRRLVAQAGFEICVIAIRAGLIGRSVSMPAAAGWLSSPPARGGVPSRAGSSAIHATLGDLAARPGLLLERRPEQVGGNALHRRVVFPTRNALVLAEGASLAGEPIRLTESTEAPKWVAYVPESVESERQNGSRGRSTRKRRFWPRGARTTRLPILMYHRIAGSGSPATLRYRIDPAAFERQLDWLRSSGYQSIDFDTWREAARRREPVNGKAIIITFDDGYVDFAQVAWPLLRRYGFGATLFVPTAFAGRTNEWDRDIGETSSLLGWREIRALHEDGVDIGGHSATHRDLSSLPIATVVDELARSRVTLMRQAGITPQAVAYPYGIFDDVIRHYAGGCGYAFGLTTVPRRALLHDSLLALPRIEVRGDAGFDEFVHQLEPPG